MAYNTYISTQKNSPTVNFKEAVLQGLAPDRGLYIPENIPEISSEDLQTWIDKKLSFQDTAFFVLKKFIEDEIPEKTLKSIIEDSCNFAFPIENLPKSEYVKIAHLTQGPTANYKDFSARFLARVMSYFLKEENKKMTIALAMSSNTGGVIAHAFEGVDNLEVAIIFPESELTVIQKKQLTTIGKNINSVALQGSFDDCREYVRKVFRDKNLENLYLSSASTINIGRILPYVVHYVFSYIHSVQTADTQVNFAIPSGSLANVCAAHIAQVMGLPIKKIVVGMNENKAFADFLRTGEYVKKDDIRDCISNEISVGHAVNFARIVGMYGGKVDEDGQVEEKPDLEKMRKDFYVQSISDEKTKDTIRSLYLKNKTLIEPHCAVAMAAYKNYMNNFPEERETPAVVFQTVHPGKYRDLIQEVTGSMPEGTAPIEQLYQRYESYKVIENDYNEFKKLLLL